MWISSSDYIDGDVKELQGKGRLVLGVDNSLDSDDEEENSDLDSTIVMDDTWRSDGSIVVLHGLPSQINTALNKIRYVWTPADPSSLESREHASFENQIWINVFDRFGNVKSASSTILVQQAEEHKRARQLTLGKWIIFEVDL